MENDLSSLDMFMHMHNADKEKDDGDKNEELNKKKIHHSVMGREIAKLNVIRANFPIILIIGKSETGKSSLTSVMGTNPNMTTIFTEWNEVEERVQREQDEIEASMEEFKDEDIFLAKYSSTSVSGGEDEDGNPKPRITIDTTDNRPRSPKFTGLVETANDKNILLKHIILPVIERMRTFKYEEKSYAPGEIPIVYYNESTKDAIFHYDVFILVTVTGQESGGSKHKVVLKVRNNEKVDLSHATAKKRHNVKGSKYLEDSEFGVKHITCFPMDMMVYLSLCGPVRVTSVNSSTFATKNVHSATQKGGLNDTVVNTPNYISNVIGEWGGIIINEIRDDWDKSDTLFGAGDIAVEIMKDDAGISTIKKFRQRDGALGEREFFATKCLNKLIFTVTLRCLKNDLIVDLQLLQSLVTFVDAFLEFAELEKTRINDLLISGDLTELDTRTDETAAIMLSVEDYISICQIRDMKSEYDLFLEIKNIYTA